MTMQTKLYPRLCEYALKKSLTKWKKFQVKFPKKSFSSIKKTTDTEHRVTHWEFVLFYAGIYKTMLCLSVFALGLHTVLLIVKKHEANCFCCVSVKVFKSFLSSIKLTGNMQIEALENRLEFIRISLGLF